MATLYRRWWLWIAGILLAASTVVVLRQHGASLDSKREWDRQGSRASFQAVPRQLSETERNSRKLREASDRFEKIDENKLLNALADPDHDAGLNRCGRVLKEELERTRDYDSIGKFLANLPKSDAKGLLIAWVFGSSTAAGPAGDFDEQKRLVENLGLEKDLRLSDRLYREAGGNAFPELARRNAGDLGEARWLEMALKGSASHRGVKETVEALPDLVSDDHAVPSVKRAVEWLLASNSTETSVAIGELPSGYPRDVMIEAMIGWLEKKGEAASIEAWVDLVSDPVVKKRLQGKTTE